jgi:DNA-binding response OmpR family regulator
MKILIADIEPDFNNTLKQFFEKLSFIAYTADTKEEALDAVKKYRPDIVSIDVREKPHYRLRLDILKKIKEIDKNIRIIVVTTYEKEDVDVIKTIGVDGYFNKPLNLENYLTLIKCGKSS